MTLAVDFLSITTSIEVGRNSHLLLYKLSRFSRVKERPSRVIRWATIFEIVGIGVREGSRIVDRQLGSVGRVLFRHC